MCVGGGSQRNIKWLEMEWKLGLPTQPANSFLLSLSLSQTVEQTSAKACLRTSLKLLKLGFWQPQSLLDFPHTVQKMLLPTLVPLMRLASLVLASKAKQLDLSPQFPQ